MDKLNGDINKTENDTDKVSLKAVLINFRQFNFFFVEYQFQLTHLKIRIYDKKVDILQYQRPVLSFH